MCLNGQPCHQPRRQRRPAGIVVIDRAESLLEKPPIDRAGEPRQRMIEIDNLIEPGLEQIVLSALSTLLRPHQSPRRCFNSDGITT
jgi:hypothetical protein